LEGNLIAEIRENGFQTYTLNQGTLEKASKKWEKDAEQTITILKDIKPEWLIVDHYNIDFKLETKVHPYCSNLMVIDDLANRLHSCEILLDQNLGRNINDYQNLLIKKTTTLLTGPKFALLRNEFLTQRVFSVSRKRELKKILISMGGVDNQNVTAQILNYLNFCQLPEHIEITVILGKNSPWIKNIYEVSKMMRWNTKILINCKNMAKELSLTDLAIGAAGTTSWERCCLGVPSIIFCLADNQKLIAENLAKAGAATLMRVESMKNELDIFFKDLDTFDKKLTAISAKAAKITDGLGASTVATYLKPKRGI
jgi:UDP-2,4-diacetamido-2,4,6-trideoxy-beta-L-altropyranose hydrolase